jgi:hypothetical protein
MKPATTKEKSQESCVSTLVKQGKEEKEEEK